MYRAVAWKAIDEGLDLQDESAVAALSERARFDLEAGRAVIDGIGRVAGDSNAGDRRRGDDRGEASGSPARARRPAAGHRPRRRRRHGRPRHRHGRVSRCRREDLPRRVPRGTRPPPRQRSGAPQLHGRGPGRGRDRTGRARSQRLDPGGIAAVDGARRHPHRDDRRRDRVGGRARPGDCRRAPLTHPGEKRNGEDPGRGVSRSARAESTLRRMPRILHTGRAARCRRLVALCLFDPRSWRRRAPTSSGRSGAGHR